MAEDLRGLGYDPVLFSTPKGDGVKFEYRIGDGSREGEAVMLGMAMRDRDGEWPEIPRQASAAILVEENTGISRPRPHAHGLL